MVENSCPCTKLVFGWLISILTSLISSFFYHGITFPIINDVTTRALMHVFGIAKQVETLEKY